MLFSGPHFPVTPDVVCQAVSRRSESLTGEARQDFNDGRLCAASALQLLTGTDSSVSVGRDASRRPIWPDGAVGSITHCDSLAAAAVGLSSRFASLGIDTEGILDSSAVTEVRELVSHPGEMALLRHGGLPADVSLTLIFSAKEALYKCLNPLVNRFFEFTDVRVVSINRTIGVMEFELQRGLSEQFARGRHVLVWYSRTGNLVHTWMGIDPDGFSV